MNAQIFPGDPPQQRRYVTSQDAKSDWQVFLDLAPKYVTSFSERRFPRVGRFLHPSVFKGFCPRQLLLVLCVGSVPALLDLSWERGCFDLAPRWDPLSFCFPMGLPKGDGLVEKRDGEGIPILLASLGQHALSLISPGPGIFLDTSLRSLHSYLLVSSIPLPSFKSIYLKILIMYMCVSVGICT